MPTFHYKIQDTAGKYEEGDVVAENKYTLANQMKSEGKTVIVINEVAKKKWGTIEFTFLTRVKLQDKILFTKNLGAMIDAGMPLSRALDILMRQTKNAKFKKILQTIHEEITKGNSLSEALGKFPKIFSPLMISMVRVGEESGNLSESLRVVGVQLNNSYTLRKKVKGAMMYPTVVMAAMVIIGILMFMYVVPTLTATFKDMEAELPKSTQVVIFISDTLAAHPLLVFGLIFGFAIAVIVGGKTRRGKLFFDFVSIHAPVLSKIVKDYNVALTARTLASLLSSGVGVVESLTITQDVLQNSKYKKVLAGAIIDVQKGIPLSSSFIENETLYEPLVGGMLEVGEETGQLSKMLEEMAGFYENEVSQATKDLSTIIEPILMVVIGSAVGFFAVSMITPMYSVMDNLN